MSLEVLCCLVLIAALAVMISGNELNSLGQLLQYGNDKDISRSSSQSAEKQSQAGPISRELSVALKSPRKITMLFKVVTFLLLLSLSKLVWAKNGYCALGLGIVLDALTGI